MLDNIIEIQRQTDEQRNDIMQRAILAVYKINNNITYI